MMEHEQDELLRRCCGSKLKVRAVMLVFRLIWLLKADPVVSGEAHKGLCCHVVLIVLLEFFGFSVFGCFVMSLPFISVCYIDFYFWKTWRTNRLTWLNYFHQIIEVIMKPAADSNVCLLFFHPIKMTVTATNKGLCSSVSLWRCLRCSLMWIGLCGGHWFRMLVP